VYDLSHVIQVDDLDVRDNLYDLSHVIQVDDLSQETRKFINNKQANNYSY